ncbi:SAM-dependent methyltransferase [Glycomyces luteolus]|uniref:SAM-dependent methyltransferase n=1 Tax=Glycomyces luteolus TaxID=2670330 RepID=A0A9X3T557_9ACTN|nr:SAM-dependent methyltransferase [Glycomyces luteolus]MDA1361810.1 SAM-dependent methyltransferase [Glycomyces luteolus]
MTGFERWSAAMARALYGPGGFYRRELPGRHFATSAQTPAFAEAVARFADQVDERLGRPEAFTVVDVGAGGGELLERLAGLLDERIRLVAVELRPRPEYLPGRVEWQAEVPESVEGLLIACELLDNAPCDVAVVDARGRVRYEEVDETGETRLGDPISSADAAWLAEWWPIAAEGERAEIGTPREDLWRGLTARLALGTALAIDYGHLKGDRPRSGTMTGFKGGRETPPIPDGTRDITAHVAVDAIACDHLESQRDALLRLGLDAALPDLALAFQDPIRYAEELARASASTRLTDPAGLGAHWWLRTERRPESPGAVRR